MPGSQLWPKDEESVPNGAIHWPSPGLAHGQGETGTGYGVSFPSPEQQTLGGERGPADSVTTPGAQSHTGPRHRNSGLSWCRVPFRPTCGGGPDSPWFCAPAHQFSSEGEGVEERWWLPGRLGLFLSFSLKVGHLQARQVIPDAPTLWAAQISLLYPWTLLFTSSYLHMSCARI